MYKKRYLPGEFDEEPQMARNNIIILAFKVK